MRSPRSTARATSATSEAARRWSFVTNHARVLACISTDSNARIRDIAAAAGITERTAAHIVNDREQAGYSTRAARGGATST